MILKELFKANCSWDERTIITYIDTKNHVSNRCSFLTILDSKYEEREVYMFDSHTIWFK